MNLYINVARNGNKSHVFSRKLCIYLKNIFTEQATSWIIMSSTSVPCVWIHFQWPGIPSHLVLSSWNLSWVGPGWRACAGTQLSGLAKSRQTPKFWNIFMLWDVHQSNSCVSPGMCSLIKKVAICSNNETRAERLMKVFLFEGRVIERLFHPVIRSLSTTYVPTHFLNRTQLDLYRHTYKNFIPSWTSCQFVDWPDSKPVHSLVYISFVKNEMHLWWANAILFIA